ncbi:MAG: hypothetical protein ACR2LM_07110 [Pyrinomonadaceae bacterium]
MNKTTRLLSGIALGVLVLSIAGSANAQEKQAALGRAAIEHDIIMQGPEGPTPPPHGDFIFVSSEMRYDGKRVQGAPYSAQAVTESTQTLGDGNRIARKSTATIYRDSEGRTRREQTLRAIGPLAADGEPAQTIFISDPVAGVHYSLDVRGRTARKMMPMQFKYEMKPPPPEGAKGVTFEKPIDRIQIERHAVGQKITAEGAVRIAPPEGGVVMAWHGAREGKARKESLGKQVIEGVEAEGTRSTLTIPAGEIGNERAIEIVSERWYSPELQTVVMTRHSDPRFGETTYKLTNISRTEPDRSLFEVPGGYTFKEDVMPQKIRMKRPAGEQ